MGLNKVLYEQVVPFLKTAVDHLQTSSPYFFIRYGEDGPHIRLRIQILEEEENTVRRLLNRYATAQYIPYVPEVERYGGPSAIALAEQQFFLCSEYALTQISRPEWDNSRVLAQAIQMNITLLYALQSTPRETLNICSQFVRSWLPKLYNRQQSSMDEEKYFLSLFEKQFGLYAPVILSPTATLWVALQQGRATVQQYADRHILLLRRYQQEINDVRKMRAIMCSLLHMQHNRLGIPNADEAYVVFFTMKCMEHIYEQVT